MPSAIASYIVFFFFFFFKFYKAYDVEVKEKLAQWSLDYMNGVIVQIAYAINRGASIIFKLIRITCRHLEAVRVLLAFFFFKALLLLLQNMKIAVTTSSFCRFCITFLIPLHACFI